MRNKRRQRHLWVCTAHRVAYPKWWDDRETRVDVLALSLPVERRLQAFAKLGRTVVP